MNINLKGSLIVFASSVLYAFNGFISKTLITDGMDPVFTLFLRYVFATAILVVYILMKDKKLLIVPRKQILATILLGLCLFGNGMGYFFSLIYLDLSVAIVLLYTYPAFTAIVSVLVFKEKIPLNTVIAILCTFGGILLTLNIFSSSFSNLSIIGVALVSIGVISSVGYVFVSKKLTTNVSILTANCYSFMVTAFVLGFFIPFQVKSFSMSLPELGIILLTSFIVVIAFLCYNLGIKLLTPAKAAIICSSEPIVSIILAAVFLKESIGGLQIMGAFLVIAAIVILQITPKKTQLLKKQ